MPRSTERLQRGLDFAHPNKFKRIAELLNAQARLNLYIGKPEEQNIFDKALTGKDSQKCSIYYLPNDVKQMIGERIRLQRLQRMMQSPRCHTGGARSGRKCRAKKKKTKKKKSKKKKKTKMNKRSSK